MEPTTIATVGVLTGVAKDFVIGKCLDILAGKVVAHWTDFRARQFVEAFISAVAKGEDNSAIQAKLDAIASDPVKSAALFDAYRRVVLSASSVLGPRVIALIMAQIICENRQPTNDEELIMAAVRELNDAELIAARDDWYQNYGHRTPRSGTPSFYRIGQPIAYFEQQNVTDKTGGFWFAQGPWASKLSALGFMWMKQRYVQHGGYTSEREPTLATDLFWAPVWDAFAIAITEAEELGKTDESAG